MSFLLDTHTFLWWINGDALPPSVSQVLGNAGNTVWLSAVSAWEITIKASLGKLRLPGRVAWFVEQQRLQNQFDWLPVEPAALDILQDLPFHHRDPFDRLLIAQALQLACPILSIDGAFDAYPVKRIW